MNAYEQLKLDIYESGLDFEDCKEIVNIMESCTDDEAEEVIEAVLDLVEESNMSDVEKVANALENHPKKNCCCNFCCGCKFGSCSERKL